jgi:hypothetical protein
MSVGQMSVYPNSTPKAPKCLSNICEYSFLPYVLLHGLALKLAYLEKKNKQGQEYFLILKTL